MLNMKSLSLAIASLWLAPLSVGAQPELSVALKGGPNAATVNRENRTHKYGISGGLAGSLQWSLRDRLSLGVQIGLLYTPRGAETVREGEYLGTVRERYFDVTVAFRPDLRLGPTSIYLLLGSSWSLLLNATNYSESSGTTRDVTALASRHDVALLAGVGIALHLPAKKLGPFCLETVFLEGRHDRGLIDVDEDPDLSAKNRNTSLMLGVSFVLGSKSE
jgi:hypothetical protein